MRSRESAHIAFKRQRSSAYEAADLAALLYQLDAALLVLEGSRDKLASQILCAELHSRAAPPIILVENDLLTETVTDEEGSWDNTMPNKSEVKPADFALSRPSWLGAGRGLYLWSVPAGQTLPASLTTWIGTCLGPLRHDAAWVGSIIARYLGSSADDPTVAASVRAFARRLDDPRDAGAMAAIVRAIISAGLAEQHVACAQVAASFTESPPPATALASTFDARLLVCGDEAYQLLDRAREAAQNGVRILTHGPPGGGKSAYLRALAAKMADGRSIRVITPANFLARAWGGTERMTQQLWRHAAAEGEILIADEFEVICGRRVHGEMSNNQSLIRSLTDEWLRALDEYPGVPLLASTNDTTAIDKAALRRFAFVLAFGECLSPEQERLGWRLLLDREAPSAWRPCGAAVADIVLARQRCQMLGLSSATDIEAAIAAAKAARTGRVGSALSHKLAVATKH